MLTALNSLMVIIAAVVLTACSEDKAKNVETVTVKTIAQQNQEIAERLQEQMAANEKKSFAEGEAAERQRLIDFIQSAKQRWADFFYQLPGKNLTEVGELLKQMKAVRNEMATVPTSPCTASKRTEIAAHMQVVEALLAEFIAARGEVGADFPNRLGEAYMEVEKSERTLGSCS